MPKDMTTFYTGSSDPAEALRSLLEDSLNLDTSL